MTEYQDRDRKYILNILLPELRDRFVAWNGEYEQERDLGARGEWAGLYRKARKLKTAIWDNDHLAPAAPHLNWRESIRTIALEVAGHALLLVTDLDRAAMQPKLTDWAPAPGCMLLHKYGTEGWRPGELGQPHEHQVGVLSECGLPFPCGHNPDGSNHPTAPGSGPPEWT